MLVEDDAGPSGDSSKSFVIPRGLLGKNQKLEIPHEMGVGTMAWGDEAAGFVADPRVKPRLGQFNPADLEMAYRALVAAGITFFDTADVYAYKSMKAGLSSEQLLGKFIDNSDGERPIIAAKYMPVLWTKLLVGGPWRAGRRAVAAALRRSLDRLGVAYVDLYQVHFPFPYAGGMEALAEGFAMARDRGLCRHVGVSNFNAAQVTDFHTRLKSRGVALASNQIEYSLINQRAAEDGTIGECKRLGVIPIAHTPLGKGLATGIYTAMNPTGGKTGPPRYSFQDLEPLLPVHNALAEVATRVSSRLSKQQKEDDEGEAPPPVRKVTTTQVSLNYIRAKGVVPLPGVRTKREADEVIGCLGWRLNGEDVEILDNAYSEYTKARGGKTVKRGKAPDLQRVSLVNKRTSRSWATNPKDL
ncbi:unnamed protein product [Phaeothamnion confervicola]